MLFCLDEKHMIPKFEWGKTYYIDGCLKRHNRELYKQNGNTVKIMRKLKQKEMTKKMRRKKMDLIISDPVVIYP